MSGRGTPASGSTRPASREGSAAPGSTLPSPRGIDATWSPSKEDSNTQMLMAAGPVLTPRLVGGSVVVMKRQPSGQLTVLDDAGKSDLSVRGAFKRANSAPMLVPRPDTLPASSNTGAGPTSPSSSSGVRRPPLRPASSFAVTRRTRGAGLEPVLSRSDIENVDDGDDDHDEEVVEVQTGGELHAANVDRAVGPATPPPAAALQRVGSVKSAMHTPHSASTDRASRSVTFAEAGDVTDIEPAAAAPASAPAAAPGPVEPAQPAPAGEGAAVHSTHDASCQTSIELEAAPTQPAATVIHATEEQSSVPSTAATAPDAPAPVGEAVSEQATPADEAAVTEQTEQQTNNSGAAAVTEPVVVAVAEQPLAVPVELESSSVVPVDGAAAASAAAEQQPEASPSAHDQTQQQQTTASTAAPAMEPPTHQHNAPQVAVTTPQRAGATAPAAATPTATTATGLQEPAAQFTPASAAASPASSPQELVVQRLAFALEQSEHRVAQLTELVVALGVVQTAALPWAPPPMDPQPASRHGSRKQSANRYPPTDPQDNRAAVSVMVDTVLAAAASRVAHLAEAEAGADHLHPHSGSSRSPARALERPSTASRMIIPLTPEQQAMLHSLQPRPASANPALSAATALAEEMSRNSTARLTGLRYEGAGPPVPAHGSSSSKAGAAPAAAASHQHHHAGDSGTDIPYDDGDGDSEVEIEEAQRIEREQDAIQQAQQVQQIGGSQRESPGSRRRQRPRAAGQSGPASPTSPSHHLDGDDAEFLVPAAMARDPYATMPSATQLSPFPSPPKYPVPSPQREYVPYDYSYSSSASSAAYPPAHRLPQSQHARSSVPPNTPAAVEAQTWAQQWLRHYGVAPDGRPATAAGRQPQAPVGEPRRDVPPPQLSLDPLQQSAQRLKGNKPLPQPVVGKPTGLRFPVIARPTDEVYYERPSTGVSFNGPGWPKPQGRDKPWRAARRQDSTLPIASRPSAGSATQLSTQRPSTSAGPTAAAAYTAAASASSAAPFSHFPPPTPNERPAITAFPQPVSSTLSMRSSLGYSMLAMLRPQGVSVPELRVMPQPESRGSKRPGTRGRAEDGDPSPYAGALQWPALTAAAQLRSGRSR